MAANDEFPRGWTLVSATGGATPSSITVPPVPGIIHILDDFSVKIINNGGGLITSVTVTFTGATTVTLAFLIVEAAQGSVDSASGSGLGLSSVPGGSLVVAINATTASELQLLVAQGHDI